MGLDPPQAVSVIDVPTSREPVPSISGEWLGGLGDRIGAAAQVIVLTRQPITLWKTSRATAAHGGDLTREFESRDTLSTSHSTGALPFLSGSHRKSYERRKQLLQADDVHRCALLRTFGGHAKRCGSLTARRRR